LQSQYTVFPCDNFVKAILGQAWAVAEVAFIWNFIQKNQMFWLILAFFSCFGRQVEPFS